jgi:hypothetical protein
MLIPHFLHLGGRIRALRLYRRWQGNESVCSDVMIPLRGASSCRSYHCRGVQNLVPRTSVLHSYRWNCSSSVAAGSVGSQMAVRLSALRAGSPLLPRKFLVVISVRGWVDTRAIVWLEGIGELKKSNEIIGTRNRDLSACSVVSQQTTLQCAPNVLRGILIYWNASDLTLCSLRK